MLDWKTSQLLQLFQKSPAWIPSILRQGLGVSRVYISYRRPDRDTSSPRPWEPVGASALLSERLQAATSRWVLPGLGAEHWANHPGNHPPGLPLRHVNCPPHLSGSSARPRSRFHVRKLNFDIKFPIFRYFCGFCSPPALLLYSCPGPPPSGRTFLTSLHHQVHLTIPGCS